jgi:hypothetical protein
MVDQITEKKQDSTDEKDFGEGIFDMQFINDAYKTGDVKKAKELCIKKIDDSKATDQNKRKAKSMVQMANGLVKLIHGLTSFSLAHQGLGVIGGKAERSVSKK